MGVSWEARLGGSRAFPLLHFFFSFDAPAAKSGRVSWTEVLEAAASLRRAVLVAAATASPTRAHCRKPQSSSMELWGTYLLLCLLSLLTQVTAESPTPKVKKAANVKKGKEGLGPLSVSQGVGHLLLCSPSGSFWTKSWALRGVPRPLSPGAWESSPTAGLVARTIRITDSQNRKEPSRSSKLTSTRLPVPCGHFGRGSLETLPLSSENAGGLCFVTSEPQVSQL